MSQDVRALVRSRLASTIESDLTCHISVGWIDQRDTLPAVTINVINDQPFISLNGATTMSTARVQIDCWADSASGAVALKSAVYDALQCYTSSGVIYKTRKIGETDFSEPPRDNSNSWTHRISQDYAIQYYIDLPQT